MFRKQRLFLFDLDGTTLFTWPYICASHGYVLDKLGLPKGALNHPEMRHCILERAYEICGISKDKYELASSLHKEFCTPENLKLIERFEHTENVLKALYRNHKRLGIVTNRQGNTRLLMKFTDIEKYFQYVVAMEDVTQPKPHPEGILKAMDAFGIGPNQTVFVGDTVADIIAGNEAGCTTVAVDGSNCMEALIAQNPDYVIKDIGELMHLPICADLIPAWVK